VRAPREIALRPRAGRDHGREETPATSLIAQGHALQDLSIALVHDWLITLGGADRVLLALHQLVPTAPVFVALHDRQRLPEAFQGMDVHASWLQRFPRGTSHHRHLLPLMPLAFRTLDLRGYKVVLSSSHACAKGVRVDRDAVHICYCHTPMRYVWDLALLYRRALPPLLRPAATVLQAWLRGWDRRSARGVTHFIANSQFVAERIRRHYRRQSSVIYPPVDVDFFTPGEREIEDYFLVVSRLVPYKRVDLAVDAFNQLGYRLTIVGDGPEASRLRAMARPNVTLVGEVTDEALRSYYRRCRALVFPGEEDFGIVPVEAQACGRPVIAYDTGGVRETVVDRRTGVLFPEQSSAALASAVRAFDPHAYDPVEIRRQAERFSVQTFQRQIGRFISRVHQRATWLQWTDSATPAGDQGGLDGLHPDSAQGP